MDYVFYLLFDTVGETLISVQGDTQRQKEAPRKSQTSGKPTKQFRRPQGVCQPGEEQHQRNNGGREQAGNLADRIEPLDDH